MTTFNARKIVLEYLEIQIIKRNMYKEKQVLEVIISKFNIIVSKFFQKY